MTVHQHGGHQSSDDDGQPTRFLIERGARRTYTYPLTDAGEPMPAAFRFYHDHRMGRTARNNWCGLQGMFLVTDPAERELGLPRGPYDVPLHLTDRSLDDEQPADGHVPRPDMHDWMTGAHAPPNDATVGKRILVNGQFAPYLAVSPGRYRLRLLNASTFSAYNLALSNGRPLVQVGTGSALLPRKVERPDILLGPAQRADVVVDFRGCGTRTCCCPPSRATTAPTAPAPGRRRSCSSGCAGHAHPSPPVPDRLRPVPTSTSPTRSPRSGRSA